MGEDMQRGSMIGAKAQDVCLGLEELAEEVMTLKFPVLT